MNFLKSEELKAAVGIEVGVSDWLEVTQDRINKFAEATCSEPWIHVDQERTKAEMPGGKTIAHGPLSLSLTLMFIRPVMELKGLKNTLNYGADRIRSLASSRRFRRARNCAAASASRKPRTYRPTACACTIAW